MIGIAVAWFPEQVHPGIRIVGCQFHPGFDGPVAGQVQVGVMRHGQERPGFEAVAHVGNGRGFVGDGRKTSDSIWNQGATVVQIVVEMQQQERVLVVEVGAADLIGLHNLERFAGG